MQPEQAMQVISSLKERYSHIPNFNNFILSACETLNVKPSAFTNFVRRTIDKNKIVGLFPEDLNRLYTHFHNIANTALEKCEYGYYSTMYVHACRLKIIEHHMLNKK